MDLTKTYVNKVPQPSQDGHFLLKTELSPNDIKVRIFDTYQSQEWEGSISVDELKQTAEELEIPFNNFYCECKDALTINSGVELFKYSLENNKFSVIKKDKFQIKYMDIDLRESTVSNFSLEAIDLIASLRTELSACQKESKSLSEKYQEMVKTLEKCIAEKNQLEKNLLEKFAVLLNAKKDKIAELQNLLVEKNRILEDAGVSGNQSKRKSTDLIPEDDDDDDSDDFNRPTQVMSQTRTLPKRVKLRT